MQRKKAIKPPSFLAQIRSKNRIFLLSMASILSLLVLSLFLAFSLCSATHRNLHRPPSSHHSNKDPNQPPASVTPEIHQACKATQFPELCETSLSKNTFPNPPKPVDIIFAAMEISAQNLKTAQSMAQTILDHANGNPNTTIAAKNCIEILGFSQYRLSLASAPEILPRGKIKDARAWMSASALYQYDCWSALKYVNTTQLVNETMAFVNSLTELTSNALSMIVSYDLFGNDTVSWRPPRTERDGFWGNDNGGGTGSGFKGGFPSGLTPDVTVCKTEAGCYRTVQSAVDAAPELLSGGRRFVIHIKEGVYEEIVRVPLAKRNLVFLGDGMGKTVITGKLSVQLPGVSTYNTATVGVVGDGFLASGLTIENTAGPDAHQAVAYRSDSDFSIVENCEFKGHQDTLYAHSLRQLYNRCRIMGTIDFIFGNSATVFQDCTIQVQPRQLKPEKGETNAVTAQGRTDPAQSTGFVFQRCSINGTDDYMRLYYQNPKVHKTYLGRPWKQYSRVVFIQCSLEALIRPEGWLPWDGDFALSTLFYGEFDNLGPGASTSGRVTWSNQIPAEHVSVYSLENFIQADEWLPSAPPQ